MSPSRKKAISPKLSRGSLLTLKKRRRHGKPLLPVHSGNGDTGKRLAEFIATNSIQVLNVAGPRASTEPTVGQFVRTVLQEMWASSV
jgi:hypothetical protein